MYAFIWTIVVMLCLDVASKVGRLWLGIYERKPGAMATEAIIHVGLILWAGYLLGASQ